MQRIQQTIICKKQLGLWYKRKHKLPRWNVDSWGRYVSWSNWNLKNKCMQLTNLQSKLMLQGWFTNLNCWTPHSTVHPANQYTPSITKTHHAPANLCSHKLWWWSDWFSLANWMANAHVSINCNTSVRIVSLWVWHTCSKPAHPLCCTPPVIQWHDPLASPNNIITAAKSALLVFIGSEPVNPALWITRHDDLQTIADNSSALPHITPQQNSSNTEGQQSWRAKNPHSLP